MLNVQTELAQYLAKYNGQSIACSPYTLTKLGVDRARCYLKIDGYVVLCAPFQLGFSRALFLASLSRQELSFFHRYVNTIVGLSIEFSPDRRQKPIKFFIHCTLATVGQMKGRDNVGLFVVDYKSTPHDLVILLGDYLEGQNRLRKQYDDYGKSPIRMTPEAAKILGYNMYASIEEPNGPEKRVQVFNLSTKAIDHLEAAASSERSPGTPVVYRIFFRKYRVTVSGTVNNSGRLPQGIVRTAANLAYCPELVEIIGGYWYAARPAPLKSPGPHFMKGYYGKFN
jgi:hypothetical protein